MEDSSFYAFTPLSVVVEAGARAGVAAVAVAGIPGLARKEKTRDEGGNMSKEYNSDPQSFPFSSHSHSKKVQTRH